MEEVAALGMVTARSNVVQTAPLGPARRRFANAALVLDSELAPPSLLAAHPDSTWHIPMQPGARSLNLSTAVAITLYEAVRQRR